MRFKRILLSLLLGALLLIGGTVSAQDGTLTAIETLLTQAESALDSDDLATAQAYLLGATALITDDASTSCATLPSAKVLLTQASTASDVATTRALLDSAQTLIASCSSEAGSSGENANNAGNVQGQPQGAAPQGQPQGAPQSQQAGAPQGAASGGTQNDSSVFTADNVHQITELYQLGDGRIGDLDLSPDGTTLALSGETAVWLLDAHNLQAEPRRLPLDCRPRSDAVWSPDGSKIAAACSGGLIQIVDVVSGHVVADLTGHSSFIYQLDWSPDGRWLLSSSYDQQVLVWDTASNTLHAKVTSSRRLQSVDWAPDGHAFAAGDDIGTIRIFDGVTFSEIQSFTPGTNLPVNTVAWSPDSTRLVSGGSDGFVRVWNPVTAQEELAVSFGNRDNYIVAVAWSPSGQAITAYNAYTDAEIMIWNAQTGALINQLDANSQSDLVFINDHQLVTSGFDKVIQFDVNSRQRTAEYVFDISRSNPTWSPDGTQFVYALTNREVRIHQAANGELLKTFSSPDRNLLGNAVWSPDGQFIAINASGQNHYDDIGPIFIWEPATDSIVAELATGWQTLIGWSPSGQFLGVYTWGQNQFTIWDTATWQVITTLSNIEDDNIAFLTNTLVAVLPNLAPDSDAIIVHLYDAPTGNLIGSDVFTNIPESTAHHLTRIYPSPDGSELVVSTSTGVNLYRRDDNTFSFEAAIPADDWYPPVSWSADGQLLMIDGDIYAAATQERLNSTGISRMHWQWAPDGSHLNWENQGIVHIYGIPE